MKAIFVGRKKPYFSQKTSKTYYGAFFDVRDEEGYSTVQEMDTTERSHLELSKAEGGELLDLDVTPRMFAGKIQGLTVVGING